MSWPDKVEAVNNEVRRAFKPEFVNRLDDIVVFRSLSNDDLAQIVEITIDRLQQRLSERRLELAVTPSARSWLADHGYDPTYGARPLRRLMQKEIDDRLATALLSGDIHDGDTVKVDVAEDGSGLAVASFEADLTMDSNWEEELGQQASDN